MRKFGIIGYPLHHSFSAKYFTEKFEREHIDAEYKLYPIESKEMENGAKPLIMLMKELDGFNVTLPYKETVIPYLDQLDDTAATIGAVNVICDHVGYNTDCLGFIRSIEPILLKTDKKALVLGTGGAAKAVTYGLNKLGVETLSVSRTPREGMIGYDQMTAYIMDEYSVIVNCTPLGMFPDVETCAPIPYSLLSSKHLLFDCVYNPEETLFLRKGREQGARTKNGLEMLYGQAVEAWKIWNSVK